MENCTKTSHVRIFQKRETFVYVCLNCGRRSWDRQGLNPLTPGWGKSCAQTAVRLPSKALEINPQGLVRAIRKDEILALRKAPLN